MSNNTLFIRVFGLFVVLSLAMYLVSYFVFTDEKDQNGLLDFGKITQDDVEHPKKDEWAFDGMFGDFDRQSAQRGYQVYKEVCANCHSMDLVAFRNLQAIGFSEAETKVLAADYDYDIIDDDGEEDTRVGNPSDKFPNPYSNKKAAAAANNGKAPPDLSLMIKARHDGANYVNSILTGYEDAPADVEVGTGLAYNPYFPGKQIAMAAPLSEGQVEYADGTDATVQQMSHDVVTFMQWAAEPEMEYRKKMGIKVLIFLSIMTIFFYVAKVRIWARVKDKK